MNVKEYISSGILDYYVLGIVSDQEKKEVECMSTIYFEIKVALNNIQYVVNEYVSFYEREPPAILKTRVMTEIERL